MANKMMGIIAQITTTLIGLVLTLLAGYIIFLSTSSANIDAEIQAEGAKIVDELRRSSTFEVPLPYTDLFLRQHYQGKHPDLAGPPLLYRIAFDLQIGTVFEKESLKEVFDIAGQGNAPGNLTGRITLWLVQQSVASLVPSRVPWPGRPAVTAFGQVPNIAPELQESLFPFGPLGIDNWVREFRVVQKTMALIADPIFRDMVSADLQKFFKDAPDFYKRLQGYNYSDWLAKMETTVNRLAISADRISSLLRLKETLSIKSRLPKLGWLALLGGILSLVGIMVPLTVLGLGLEGKVPTPVNLAVMSVVLIISAAAIWVLAADITKPPDQQFAEVRYFIPVHDQVLSDHKKRYSEVTFGFDLVSGVLADADKLGLSRKEIKLLEQYRSAIRASNAASERAASDLAIQLRSSRLLAKYKAPPGSGGRSLPVLAPLDTENKVPGFVELQPGTNVIIQDNRGRVTTDLLVLQIPQTQKELEEIREEIKGIYETFRQDKTYEELKRARVEVDRGRQSILSWLDESVQTKK